MRAFSSRSFRVAALLLTSAVNLLAAQPKQASSQAQHIMSSMAPKQLVQQIVNNEINARDYSHFTYRSRRQTLSGVKTKQLIETQDGIVARLIAIDDRPLTPDERNAENGRLQELLTRPELQQERKKEQEADENRVRKMFRELPHAFVYRYEGVQPSSAGEVIRMSFQPDPNFRPPSRETSVFKAMSGQMWVNVAEMRLVKIEASLFRDVAFGWGILGHLDKGGHFIVEQTRVAPGRWYATDMNIQFTGKVLFFKTINLRQIEKLSDFRQVPNGLSLAQGIEILNKNGSQLAGKL